ncbi:hypothetical protein GF402_07495 [Candidatus Fermentibacteria bacterium]|nr:hypothetical protein [Candidatus Fermentibacteria bacterium]
MDRRPIEIVERGYVTPGIKVEGCPFEVYVRWSDIRMHGRNILTLFDSIPFFPALDSRIFEVLVAPAVIFMVERVCPFSTHHSPL